MSASTVRQRIARSLDAGRRETVRLLAPLDDDELARQSDPIMSPLVWDLGHIGNYEELWLLRRLGDTSFADPRLDRIYDAFENPRWTRSELPLLSRSDATEYLADVRAAALRTLETAPLAGGDPLLADGFVYSLVLQHEAQHQETVLQALDLRREATPYALAVDRRPRQGRTVDDTDRVLVPAGPWVLGTDDPRSYDNERPSHAIDVPTFALDRFPVTCRRYAAFVADGGYERPELWSEAGRAWLVEHGHCAPQGWLPATDGGWQVRRFHRLRPLDPREPVEHVSWFEAEAFAAWAGGRLPTEAEWEKAATWTPVGARRRHPWGDAPPRADRANLRQPAGVVRWGPAPVGSYPAGAAPCGAEQLLGDVFEWTASGFDAYPGTVAFPYAEYSEVFYGGEYRVLRGASWASRPEVARSSFRNWDHPHRRQIFAGFRLAWDLA